MFAQLFFEPAGSSIGLLLSFASVGISFLFRPLVAVEHAPATAEALPQLGVPLGLLLATGVTALMTGLTPSR